MSEHKTFSFDELPEAAATFYREVMTVLQAAEVPFLVGGGYAFFHYTSIARDTKDLDVFVLPQESLRAVRVLQEAGFRAENKYPHWLAKAYQGEYMVDIIYSSGNGICGVDEEWFEHARSGEVLGQPVQVVPVEEMIWQKAFIMERHRFDGSDVMHLLHCHSETMDWDRLLRRFGDHWPLLLSHLVLYRFTYPGDPSPHAHARLVELARRIDNELDPQSLQAGDSSGGTNGKEALCRGTLLSLLDYLPAVHRWGYRDARLRPPGNMSPAEIDFWTQHFEK